jgi:hypothetical protein
VYDREENRKGRVKKLRRDKFYILIVGARAFSVRLLGSNIPPVPHCNKNPIYVFPEKKLCAATVPISSFMCLCLCERFIYSQDRSTYFPAAE